MTPSRYVSVIIDLDRVRSRAEAIRRETGVDLIAVIKADAYGLGAARVADALAATVSEFAFFSIDEAQAIGRGGLILGPPDGDPDLFRELGARPAVSSRAHAERYRGLRCALNVDTGMRRFGCPPDAVDDLRRMTGADEAFSQGVHPRIAATLRERTGGEISYLHVACSGLIDAPDAWLSATRPGVALYLAAVHVSTPITHVHDNVKGGGYTEFDAPRVGVFPVGYSNGVQRGPCVVNGRRQTIVEVNMNATYVTLDRTDKVGDRVVLLGEGLTEHELAAVSSVRPHEVLCRFSSLGERKYQTISGPTPSSSSVLSGT